MTTPAPSLEALPPERGTILEIHSIDDAFNGKLVEFVKIDKESGGEKVFVNSLEDEEQFMRVKVKCCRRPGIKPLKLRQILFNLSGILLCDSFGTVNDPTLDQYEAKLASLLGKDPCASPVHHMLGTIAEQKYQMQQSHCEAQTFLEQALRHFFRGSANLYAYQDIMPKKYVDGMQCLFSNLLASAGWNKSFCQLQKKRGIYEDLASGIEVEIHRLVMLGSSVFEHAKQMYGENRRSKQLATAMEAAEHLCHVLRIATSDLSSSKMYIHFWVESALRVLSEIICFLLQKILEGRDDELLALQKKVMWLSGSVLKTCVTKDGTRVFLSEDIEAVWTAASNEMRRCIEAAGQEKRTDCVHSPDQK
jgi:hypothetical protein